MQPFHIKHSPGTIYLSLHRSLLPLFILDSCSKEFLHLYEHTGTLQTEFYTAQSHQALHYFLNQKRHYQASNLCAKLQITCLPCGCGILREQAKPA